MIPVLHLIDTTGPGGAETVFTELLARMPQDRYRHHVILRGEGWVADRVRTLGYEPAFIDSKGSFNVAYLRQLIRFVRQHRIQLIHAHLLGSNVYGSLVGLITRTPVITTFHGNVDVASKERLLNIKFQMINWGAQYIVCVSNGLKRDLLQRSPLRKDKLRVIYNGVDPHAEPRLLHDRPIVRELGLPADAQLIVSIGNIRPAKGYEYLLEAAAQMNGGHTHFLVVGHPKRSLMETLNQQAQALGVTDRVHFLGFREDVRHLLAQADIFLLSSVSEGFSIATVEAMMAGIPVVATRSGGPEEIIDDQQTGILIPPRDSGAMVDAIRQLEGAELSRRLTAAARTVAIEKFSIDTMVAQYLELYGALTSPKGAVGSANA